MADVVIDATGLILIGLLVASAFVRAVRRADYRRGWHEGRADLLRERDAAPSRPTLTRLSGEPITASDIRITNSYMANHPSLYDREAE